MTFGAIKTLDNKFISNNVVVSIYLVLLEVAADLILSKINGPLGDAVAESFEKSIRSTNFKLDGPAKSY
jgi:hypothetical protein